MKPPTITVAAMSARTSARISPAACPSATMARIVSLMAAR